MKKLVLLISLAIMILSSAKAEERQEFTIDGAVGKLYTSYVRPDVKNGEKVPLVILCHGFGGGSDYNLFDDISSDLLKDGIASLKFTFNGHGKSEGEFQNMTVPNEIEDLKKVIAWAESQSWVRDISLVGHSQGGVVVSMVAGELGVSKIKNIVLLAPAAVLRDDAIRGNTMGAMYDPWNLTSDYVQLPFGGLKLGRAYIESAVNLPIYETALKYNGPALVVHGMSDRVVPFTYGERYYKGYKEGYFKLIKGEDHGFSKTTAETALYVSDWLKKRM